MMKMYEESIENILSYDRAGLETRSEGEHPGVHGLDRDVKHRIEECLERYFMLNAISRASLIGEVKTGEGRLE